VKKVDTSYMHILHYNQRDQDRLTMQNLNLDLKFKNKMRFELEI